MKEGDIKINIYKIFQTINNGFNTYDSAIVMASNEKQAKNINPRDLGDNIFIDWNNWRHTSDWVTKKEDVQVEYIGKAKKGLKVGVIVASFNAG